MPADPRFTTRAYEEGDEREILRMFAEAFPHAPRTPAHFRWKYLHDPFGARHISVTFDAGARMVGHYAGYVVPFTDRGRPLVAHQVGDTMTDPAIRHVGRGPTSILGRTALHFYGTFCEARVAFNYGFNVANIQRFSLRFLRSDRVEPVTFRVRDLRQQPLPRLARWERWGRGYSLELVSEPGSDFDDLFARAAPTYAFCVTRNAAYLRWRYLELAEQPYAVAAVRKWGKLAGWMAYRIDGRRFLWGDALFDPRFADAPEVLLRHVVAQYDVDTIEGWFPPRPHWFDDVLTGLRFETRPEPQDLSLMCVPFQFADATAAMRERLYYTWGDSDLF